MPVTQRRSFLALLFAAGEFGVKGGDQMMQQIPYFGEIDTESLRDYYCVTAELGGSKVEVDINFTQASTNSSTVTVVSQFLMKLDQMDKENRKHIDQDFTSEGETDDYFEFYLEELLEDELSGLVDQSQDRDAQKRQLLSRLELSRVGLHPDQREELGYFATFDYSIRIGDELCNQLLVINTKEDGGFAHLTWES